LSGPSGDDGSTPDGQLDLFSESGFLPSPQPAPLARPTVIAPAELDDAALLAAIAASGVADGPSLAAEAGRRRLVAAVPVLEDYCRRFSGYGLSRALAEQVAALDALAAIGGPDAARSVAQIMVRGWVQGPALANAAAAAGRLKSRLPADTVLALLRHADPAVRRHACVLARTGAEVIATLTDLLGDLHADVRIEAACALGCMGCAQAGPLLKLALGKGPTLLVIQAVAAVADEDCIVLLGRIAEGTAPDLAAAAVDALEAVEHPLAARRLERLRQGRR
jgi:hypothetical protein